jgi:hypothetical protein
LTIADIDHHIDFLRALTDRGFGFGDLGGGGVRAQRKPDHGADFHRRSGELGRDQRHPVGIHAHARKAVFTGFAAQFANVGGSCVGPQHGVIDGSRDGLIDARERIAGGEPIGAGRENLLRFLRAGLRAALRATGTHQLGNVQTFALLRGNPQSGSPGEDFLSDLRDQSI